MNLDYINITKSLCKDTFCKDYLQKNAVYNEAVQYYLKGCRNIEVWHNVNLNQMNIKGSIPYFINGHNYFSSMNDWKEGLDYIANCLNQNIYTSNVNKFEYGTIQEIPFDEKDFLHNHIKVKGMKTKPYYQGNVITGKQFENNNLKIKLYDVSRNIKNKLDYSIRKDLSSFYGWDKEKHYIKVENHYKKPEMIFKQQKIILSELLTEEWLRLLQIDLINTYNSIMKTGSIHIPATKSDINAGTIPLMVLKELESIFEINAEELIKQKIKSIPEEIFTKNDRKARIKQINENLKKISSKEKSSYDITDLLNLKLNEKNI